MNNYYVKASLIKTSNSGSKSTRTVSMVVKAESDFMAKTLAEGNFLKQYYREIADGYELVITEIRRQ